MKYKRNLLLALTALLIASMACSLFSGGSKEGGSDAPAGDAPGESEPSGPAYEPGYEPGWRIFSNANYVRGIDVYDGVLWAATEGGVVAWDLENDQPTKYTTMDGMGHISAYDVVVCPMPNPTVVVATEKGLSLFDLGTETWSSDPITPEDSHVATNDIDKLYCDEENGRLLIGYSGLGVLDIASGGWQHFTTDNGLAWNGVEGIAVSGSDIMVGGYEGVSVIKEQGIEIYNQDTGMPEKSVRSIASTPDGAVWVATSKGLIRFIGSNMSIFTNENVEGLTGTVNALTAAPDGTIWTVFDAYDGAKLCHLDPVQETCIYTYKGENKSLLSAITAGDAGDLYYSTRGDGIWAYNGSDWRHLFIEEDQLASNFVSDIFEDSDGKIWVGTENGLQVFDPSDIYSPWKTYQGEEGKMPYSKVKSIQMSPSGDIWLIHSMELSSFNGASWTKYGNAEGIDFGGVYALTFDKDGIPHVGTATGLVILGDTPILLTDADGLPNVRVLSLLNDGDFMWVGTADGLVRYDGTKIEPVLDRSWEGLPDDAILAIEKEADGSLLLGTPEGLARYDGETVVTLLEPQVVTGGVFGAQIQAISGIAIAPDGSLWVSTYAGLYHGDGENWEHFTTAEGLPANNLNTVLVDSSGVVWVGGGFSRSGGGLTRFIPGETSSAPTSGGSDDSAESSQADAGGPNNTGGIKYDNKTGLPLFPNAEQVYSSDTGLNYWSASDRVSLREFYISELANIGWLLDVDENGNCRDDDRCMGWRADYNDPETQTYFFLKGDKGYLTLNLIPEDGKVNVIFMVNEPAE